MPKPLDKSLSKSLQRTSPRKVREYKSSKEAVDKELVDVFTRADFLLYDQYYHKWGTPGRKKYQLFEAMIRNNVSGNPLKLAEIRSIDLVEHQKIWQMIKHRWTNIQEHKKELINNDADKFWLKMARGIKTRFRENKSYLSVEWQDENGTDKLIKHLKFLYETQDRKCALTGELMTLEIGNIEKNSCSPDRKNNNCGYVKGNIWLTTWWANSMKSNYTIDDFKEKIRILHESMNNRDK